ncbi:hypothetical protein D3C74_205220 [compost metagenome]
MPNPVPLTAPHLIIDHVVITARNNRGIARVNADPQYLVVDRNVAGDPIAQLLVKRLIEIERIGVRLFHLLVQRFIRIQGMADGYSAIDKIKNILSGTLHGNVQVLLLALFDEVRHPSHKQQVNDQNRQ